MASELPLKIRVDVRDLWDSPKSSVQTSVDSLTKTLGHKITPEADWNALWRELKDLYPEKTNFVPTIVRYTIAWYDRLLGRLDNDVYATWAEELLGELSSAKGRLRLDVWPAPANIKRPTTSWNKKRGSFCLYVPNTEATSQAGLSGLFDRDLENLFTEEGGADDEWAHVPEDPPRAAGVSGQATLETELRVDRLPALDALARPAELLASTPPYIMIISHLGESIRVECSHESSLELIAGYLKKWGKPNSNDSQRRSIFKVELCESDYCFGVVDSLTIEPYINYRRRINPTIILAFVEGVLGYKMVHTSGNQWMYHSTTVLK